jgi:hypothetical protein
MMVQLSMSLKTCCKAVETKKKKAYEQGKMFDIKLFLGIQVGGENSLYCLKRSTLPKF